METMDKFDILMIILQEASHSLRRLIIPIDMLDCRPKDLHLFVTILMASCPNLVELIIEDLVMLGNEKKGRTFRTIRSTPGKFG